ITPGNLSEIEISVIPAPQSFKSERFNPESFHSELSAESAGCADLAMQVRDSIFLLRNRPRTASMSNTRGVPQAAEKKSLIDQDWPSDLEAQHLLRLIHWMGSAGRQLRRQLAEVAASFALSD